MNKKNVLIVGYNYNSIKRCIDNGFNVDVLIDKWDYTFGDIKDICIGEQRVYVEECANASLALAALHHFSKKEYHAIFTDYEFTVVTTGILKDILKIENGLGATEAINFRDKFVQKSIVKPIINVTNYQIVDNFYNFKTNDLMIDYPIVVKPLAGAGTKNTFKVTNKSDYTNLIKKIQSGDNNYDSFIIEEFIDGQELYIDGVIYESEIEVFLISKYLEPVINIKKNKTLRTMVIRKSQNSELYHEIKNALSVILPKLKLKNGVFHLEVFLKTNGKIIFSECAARVGGGMIDNVFKEIYNTSLKNLLCDISINTYKKRKYILNDVVAGFAFIPTFDKEISSLPSLDEINKEIPNIKEIIYEWKPGDKLPNSQESSTNRIGMFLIVSKNEDEFLQTMEKGLNFFMKLNK